MFNSRLVAARKLKVEIYKMKLFKKDKCLLVTEENHYTGDIVDVKSLQWTGRPSSQASNSAEIANYYILKMIDPSNRCEYLEQAINDYVSEITKRNDARNNKDKGVDWGSVSISDIDDW